jgi:hypothetical protein
VLRSLDAPGPSIAITGEKIHGQIPRSHPFEIFFKSGYRHVASLFKYMVEDSEERTRMPKRIYIYVCIFTPDARMNTKENKHDTVFWHWPLSEYTVLRTKLSPPDSQGQIYSDPPPSP